jgi:hypothetical protein
MFEANIVTEKQLQENAAYTVFSISLITFILESWITW